MLLLLLLLPFLPSATAHSMDAYMARSRCICVHTGVIGATSKLEACMLPGSGHSRVWRVLPGERGWLHVLFVCPLFEA